MLERFKLSAGFTVVELIVVIAVIGILSTIVFVGYEGYEKRAQGSQVAAAITSYHDAITIGVSQETDTTPSESYSDDNDFLAACISSNTERCCFYYRLSTQTICANNTELKADNLLKTDATYNIIQEYVAEKKSQLPKFTDFGSLNKCTALTKSASTMARGCYTNQVAYTTGMPDVNNKGYLHYYLPSSYDTCYSSNVVSYVSGNPVLNGAKFTARVTTGAAPYTYCTIQIK